MAQNQILERIRLELIASEHDIRYKLGAYEFVLNGLEFYLTRLGEKRHVSGQELAVGLLNFAHKQFGPLAESVLDNYGITTTEDLGNLVYNMIELNVMSKQEEDSLDHFTGVVSFSTFFKEVDSFTIDKTFIRKVKGA